MTAALIVLIAVIVLQVVLMVILVACLRGMQEDTNATLVKITEAAIDERRELLTRIQHPTLVPRKRTETDAAEIAKTERPVHPFGKVLREVSDPESAS